MRLSEKLGALCAAAALLPFLVASILLLYEASSDASEQATRQLQSGARAGASIHEKRLVELRAAAQRLADDIANKTVISSNDAERDTNAARARLQDLITVTQNEMSLDFIMVTDPQGRVIARHNDVPETAETLLAPDDKNPIADKLIAEGAQLRNASVASAVVERGSRLARLGLNLRARVGRDESTVEEALMLEAGAPVFSAGRFIGMALIGQMLNNDYAERKGPTALHLPLVAEIKRALYGTAETGSGALVALGDRVITSSVAPEAALLGARHDTQKSEEILFDGDRSYAVSWQPIKSLDGQQLGAVGVAVKADDLTALGDKVRRLLFTIGAIALVLAAAAGYLYGRALSLRLKALTEATAALGVGELSAPVKDPAQPLRSWTARLLPPDEINGLAAQLDQTRESFRQAIERLRKR